MDKKPAKREKRLLADIPIEIHNKLKYIALMRNCTMKKLIIRSIVAYINYEEKYGK